MTLKHLTVILAVAALASAGIVPISELYHGHHPVEYTAAAPVAVLKTVAPLATYAHAPVALAHGHAHHDDDYDAHPQYKFAYDVQDALSGDSKSQVEERDGDVVRGEYSLIDADGFKRVVQYTSDAVNGFNAVVNRVPLEHAKSAYAAPVAIAKEYHHSPVAYHH